MVRNLGKSRRAAAAAAGLLGLAGLGLLVARYRGQAVDGPSAAPGGLGMHTAPQPSTQSLLPGDANTNCLTRYQLRFSSASSTRFGASSDSHPAPFQQIEASIEGVLDGEVLAQAADGKQLVRFVVQQVAAAAGPLGNAAAAPSANTAAAPSKNAAAGQSSRLAADLAGQEVMVLYDQDGHITTFLASRQAAAAKLNALKALLMPWQLDAAAAQTGGGARTQVPELDSTGTALFTYDARSGSHLVRRKTGYLNLWQQATTTPRILASQHDLTLAASSPLPLAVAANEQSIVVFDQGELNVRWDIKLARLPSAAGAACPKVGADPAAVRSHLDLVDIGAAPLLDKKAAAEAFRPTALKKSLAELMATIESPQTSPQDRSEAQYLLSKRLALVPAECDELRLEILRRQEDRGVVEALIGALAGADTAAAQTALLTLLRTFSDHGKDDLLLFTSRSHLLSPTPARENIAFILAKAETASGTERSSLYLAGSAAASRLPLAEAIAVSERLEPLAAEHKTLYIVTLANLALTQSLPKLVPFASGRDLALAQEAVRAIASLHGGDDLAVERFLLAIAAANTKPLDLRVEAVLGLEHRFIAEDSVKSLIKVYEHAASSELRAACIRAVASPEHLYWPAVRGFVQTLKAQPPRSAAEREALAL